jgi:hypothetical protein
MGKRGHAVFKNDARNYNLNIIATRDPHPKLDQFGCVLSLMWSWQGSLRLVNFRITTLPGSYYMKVRLLNNEGCAIIAPGQYRSAYSPGLHRGKYLALCQRRPVTVYRDGDRDNYFDLDPDMKRTGLYGINIHRCGRSGLVPKVGANSAGCLVFQSHLDFNEFMKLIVLAEEEWGNKFTLTVLD